MIAVETRPGARGPRCARFYRGAPPADAEAVGQRRDADGPARPLRLFPREPLRVREVRVPAPATRSKGEMMTELKESWRAKADKRD